MKYKVIITHNFEKEAKRLIRKYTSLKNELIELDKSLSKGINFGTPIGKNSYKIRLAVKSKGKGKSGGLRIINYLELDLFILDQTNIFLLSIYDKSETENITKLELTGLITNIKQK